MAFGGTASARVGLKGGWPQGGMASRGDGLRERWVVSDGLLGRCTTPGGVAHARLTRMVSRGGALRGSWSAIGGGRGPSGGGRGPSSGRVRLSSHLHHGSTRCRRKFHGCRRHYASPHPSLLAVAAERPPGGTLLQPSPPGGTLLHPRALVEPPPESFQALNFIPSLTFKRRFK